MVAEFTVLELHVGYAYLTWPGFRDYKLIRAYSGQPTVRPACWEAGLTCVYHMHLGGKLLSHWCPIFRDCEFIKARGWPYCLAREIECSIAGSMGGPRLYLTVSVNECACMGWMVSACMGWMVSSAFSWGLQRKLMGSPLRYDTDHVSHHIRRFIIISVTRWQVLAFIKAGKRLADQSNQEALQFDQSNDSFPCREITLPKTWLVSQIELT